MKLKMNFTNDLNNPQSKGFKDLAQTVKDGLFEPLNASVTGLKDVDVYGFEKGSVVVLFNIIFEVDAPAVNATQLSSAVNNVITTANFSGIPVDTSYLQISE